MNKPKFVITVGASAGGLNALIEMVSHLPEEIDAAMFIVLHLSSKGISNFLIHQLQPHTALSCSIGKDNIPIERNHIYIAPRDRHIMIKKDHMVIGKGAKENRWRPSIDLLFRSAAAAYNTHAIGIILTGLLDDGSLGMQAIKRSGGICIVQDPDEAEFPEMPMAVLDKMEVNFCIKLAEIGETLSTVTQVEKPYIEAPPDIVAEAKIAENVSTGIEKVSPLGAKSLYACPDCGGGLWELTNDNITEYRCHVGHAFSERHLLIKQAETLESTLWMALRIMEERRNLFMRLKEQNTKKGLRRIAESNQIEAELLEVHINKLKEVLFATVNKEGD
jgi:two-component system, chemotaxis family, protein-glutamate methylesterase/glutaminase